MTEIKSLWGTKFEKELKSVWIGGSDERVDVDKTKIKFIDFYCVCEEIMSPYDCTLNVVAEGQSGFTKHWHRLMSVKILVWLE